MKKTFLKKIIAITTGTLIVGATFFGEVTKVEAAEPAFSGSSAIYRLYNPDNGEHLYTTDANERNVLFKEYGWGYEGIAWYAPNIGDPVYRLYNSVLCNHLYTTSENEVAVLTEDAAWTVDNNGQPLFYSATIFDIPIYRVYNEELQGMHHWTTDKNEYATLPLYGWEQEGFSLFALSMGKPIVTMYYNGGANKIEEIEPNNFPYDMYTVTTVKLEDGTEALGYYYVNEFNPFFSEVGGNILFYDTNRELTNVARNAGVDFTRSSEKICTVGRYDDWGEVSCKYIKEY